MLNKVFVFVFDICYYIYPYFLIVFVGFTLGFKNDFDPGLFQSFSRDYKSRSCYILQDKLVTMSYCDEAGCFV